MKKIPRARWGHPIQFGHDWAKRIGTGLVTPLSFSYRSGHFRSSVNRKAQNRDGVELPWYTYPAIAFLQTRRFSDKRVLEFGAGQSTLWWAKRASRVHSFESDDQWYDSLKAILPANVRLNRVSMSDVTACVTDVRRALTERQAHGPAALFDVIVIDGLYRAEMVPIACEYRSPTGIIICDNAEGYGLRDAFDGQPLQRIDFAGYAPGVSKPHCTSLYFGRNSFVTSNDWPMASAR